MKNQLPFFLAILLTLNVSAQQSDSSVYYFNKGLEEKNNKRYLVASNYFTKAIEWNPKNVNAYLENGYVNNEMRRTDAAKACFTKVLELDPAHEAAIKEMTILFFNYRQFQQALDLVQKCSGCENKEQLIAMCYYNLEDYGKAEKYLHAWVDKNPSDAASTYTLANTYLQMHLEAKAISWYEKAVLLDDKKSNWFFELALLYSNNNQYKKAVIAYNRAADLGYQKSNAFNENLGFAYLYSGDFENAEKLLNDIMSRRPGDTEFVRDIATAFFDMKQYDKSLDYCQKLMELDMKDGKALYQAGLCFQRKGMTQKGMQMCDKAIEMDPSLAKLRSKTMNPGM